MAGSKFAEERTAAALYNCAFRSTKDIATKGGWVFSWMMDALMLGIGVGFDTLGAETLVIKEPIKLGSVYTIPDSREGWVESTQIILDAYFFGRELPEFDYSRIRGPGVPIKGFGGISAGAEPLMDLHQNLIALMETNIGELISSVVIVDIENLIGRCVVSGNVRRSAGLALGASDDTNFIEMKNDQALLDHHRWGSNNSVNAKVGMDYTKLATQTAAHGEPNYIWLDNARTHGRFVDPERTDDQQIMGFNPCVEQQLEDGECCNVVEMFIARHETLEDFLKTVKVAYLYAKTVTLAKTHWPDTNALMLKNRRIGLSVSGLVQAFEKFGRRQTFIWLDKTYKYLERLDQIYSDWLCIPRSKRMTSVKPSGTVSKLVGATPGMHFPIERCYIQRIRFNKNDAILQALCAHGYPIEPDENSPNTDIVSIPIKLENCNRTQSDVSMWEQLEIAAQMQYYWADNSVSVTISFKPEEAKDISYALELYETRLKAVSFFPLQHKYKQAPIEGITEEQYLELTSNIKPLTRLTTEISGVGEKFCDGESCQLG